MTSATSTARRWGNSIGITLPRDLVESLRINEGDEVSLFIVKKANPLKRWAGKAKFKKSTDEMMEEIDKELYTD